MGLSWYFMNICKNAACRHRMHAAIQRAAGQPPVSISGTRNTWHNDAQPTFTSLFLWKRQAIID